ncbi:MAG: FAD-dependent oxidoreductase, partial [Cephaloticoccus sp.]
REAWLADVFIDATGDGDLGAAAGCSFSMGAPLTGNVQPLSMYALFTGVRFADIEPFVGGNLSAPKQHLYSQLAQHGLELSNSVPLLVRIHENLFALCANHEYGVRATDADAITRATVRGRAETHRAVETLRQLGPVWHGIRVVATSAQIGIREGRRIHGLHLVTDADILAGIRHPDAICHVTSPIDVHSLDGGAHRGIDRQHPPAQPYDIPLRALIARDVDGLMLAGRCISGDFLAHSSYRGTGNAVVTGEAAGHAAATCIRNSVTPHEMADSDLTATTSDPV